MRKRSFWLGGAALAALLGASLLWWYSVDTRPPAWDESVHLHLALDWRDWLIHGEPVTSSWAAVYPPLFHFSLIPFLSMMSVPSAAATIPVYIGYLLLLIAGLALLAEELGGTAEDGILAAVLTIAGVHVLFTLHRPLIDFPLMAYVTFGMALLWRTRDFTLRRETLIWAAYSGLGLILKPFYPLWFVGPCLWLLSRRGKGSFVNFLFALGVIIVVCLPYYGWQGPLFIQNAIGIGGRGAEEGDPSFRQLAGWLYYVAGLKEQLSGVGLLIALAGVGLLIRRKVWRPGFSALIAWWLSGYLFFTLMSNKDLRYTLCLIPPLALAGVLGWMIFDGRWKRWAAALVLGLLFLRNTAADDRPRREDWKHVEIAQWLVSHHDPSQPFLITSVLSNDPYLFGRNLRWTMRAHGQAMATAPCGDPLADFTEFVVMKSGSLGPDAGDLQKSQKRLFDSGRTFSEVFPAVAHFPLPDGSQATIYQRDPDHVFRVGSVSSGWIARRLQQSLKRLVGGPLHVEVQGTPKDLRQGRLASVHIWGGPWTIRDAPIAQADLRLEKVWINLYQLADHGQPGLVAFDRFGGTIELRAADLQDLLAKRAKGLDDPEVHFRDGALWVRGRFRGIPVEAKGTIRHLSNPPRLYAGVSWIKIHGLPIPGWLFGKVHSQTFPLTPIPSLPGTLDVGSVTLADDRLQIAPSSR